MTRSYSILLLLLASPAWAADPFNEHVRPTDPLTPEQERKALHAPEGFEVQLFASEPDIAKPLNMAFDERGRLWLTNSLEYPYAAPLDRPGKDSIKILEDTDGDGRADKISTFADGLNIPIALLPYRGGAIVWSIPNIWHLEDQNGDGVCDKRTKLYGPLGFERDTHGMISSFRRGLDGWLYGNHGYNNVSTFVGQDGSRLELQSGNTYRLRLDGSRVEPHSYGQVNPFGTAWDVFGNLYSVDCHSLPIYQLLPGAYYPSFGKPHDGLGFGPAMIAHDHSSTGLCGLVFNEADHWPQEFRDNMFIGNVLTCRVNRDQIKFHGSTPEAVEKPDFIRSDDPWFRPVDLQMGPDGALYIADFYNKIIGHYEVPLDHPGRDRTSGRIWRVVYKGGRSQPGNLKDCDFTKLSVEQLLGELAHPNMTRRQVATNWLDDHYGPEMVEKVTGFLAGEKIPATQMAHCLWLLHRRGALTEALWLKGARHADHIARTHAMAIWGENPQIAAGDFINESLADTSADVQRAALTALGRHPEHAQVGTIARLWPNVPAEDTHLLHVLRMTLRNALRQPDGFAALRPELINAYPNELADVAAAVSTPEAGSFLLDMLEQGRLPRTRKIRGYLEHIAKYLPADRIAKLAEITRRKLGQETDIQADLYLGMIDGVSQRGISLPEEVKVWGAKLAADLLRENEDDLRWTLAPSPTDPSSENPWFPQRRAKEGGGEGLFFSSLPPGGESLVGILRSRPFTLGQSLDFWIAGHDGLPTQAPSGKNVLKLVDAETGEVLREQAPPRNDAARLVSWDLSKWTGRKARIEAQDNHDGVAYAWFAVGEFNTGDLAITERAPWQRLSTGVRMVQMTPLPEMLPDIAVLAGKEGLPSALQFEIATCLTLLRDQRENAIFLPLLKLPISLEARRAIMTLVRGEGTAKTKDVALLCMKSLPFRQQRALAVEMASSLASAEQLVALCEAQQAPARLLQERMVKEKLAALKSAALDPRVESLTKDLPPGDANLAVLVEQRKISYAKTPGDEKRGEQVFSTYCAICHQVGGKGNLVGPQLTGIGNRGLDRLLEDIIDPNRQVDPGFRTMLISLKNGDIRQGLPRREEGENLVFADAAGQEFSLKKADVAERKASATSLMPATFGEGIPEAEFHDLLAFLLQQKGQ